MGAANAAPRRSRISVQTLTLIDPTQGAFDFRSVFRHGLSVSPLPMPLSTAAVPRCSHQESGPAPRFCW